MIRLNHLPTLRIDPTKNLSLRFGGKNYQGLAGDTVATALYASGVRVFSRSLKYHRPRGLYSMDGECSNCMVEIDGLPNARAETCYLKDGMQVMAQNVIGTPENDLMGLLGHFDWAMPAGFYYRTMHKPYQIWPVFAEQVRKAAGQGKLSPDFVISGTHDEIFPTADVCVLGGGPAGMSAAIAAAQTGLRVALIEARPWLGGFFEYRPAIYEGETALYQRARDLARAVEETPNIRVFTHCYLTGIYNDNLITAFQQGSTGDYFDQRYIELRAQSVVVATGCIERPLLFEHNERPGVMQINCAHRLARTFGILPSGPAAFSVGHDLGLEAALDLSDLGLSVSAVADARPDGQDPRLVKALAQRNIPFFRGWVAGESLGGKTVTGVKLCSSDGTQTREYDCHTLVASAGMTPVTGPLTVAGAKLVYDVHTNFFLPAHLPPRMYPAGRILGLDDPFAVESSGRMAGLKAAGDCGPELDAELEAEAETLRELPGAARGCKLVTAPVKGKKSFVCFDEDTTVKNVKQAMEMGFDRPELIKRFTAAGTGPGQGGIPGHNLPLLVARFQGECLNLPQPTNVRCPLTPPLLATYAGPNHDRVKRTPMHESQKKAGAILRRVGVWRRARYFSQDFSAKEEVLRVRENVGLIDVSTLGKFRLHGPDALPILQRVYVGDMAQVKTDKLKYSAMCNEDGCLIDDGVVVKTGENDYYFTTSTGRAGATAEWLRYHSRYENWRFNIVNLTDALGAINIAGPKARAVLEKLTDADISNEAFPFMGYRELDIAGIPVRAMRLGFVGELSYELHVPASWMQALWEQIEQAGQPFGIGNFGLEAQSQLRMEKGHVIIGQESEQRTTLHDLGLGFLWDRKKADAKTVGAVALRQTENQPDRLKLVGLEMKTPQRPPQDGAIVVEKTRIRGYVCTARYSHSLQKSVGLALVDADLAEAGTTLSIFEPEAGDKRLIAVVAPPPFYDPEGKRLRM